VLEVYRDDDVIVRSPISSFYYKYMTARFLANVCIFFALNYNPRQ